MHKIGTKGTFQTGNGTLSGEVVGYLHMGGETFCRIRCQFGEVRALRAHEFKAT